MLSMHNIKDAKQAASYFSKDDYYLDHAQREPSAWWGRGAHAWGLSGEVDRDMFVKLLNGELPDGTKMPKPVPQAGAQAEDGSKSRRAGLDLTFSAPKSVSLLGLVAERTDVVRAHDAAVEAALCYLESHAAFARITQDEKTRFERTQNFVVARFSHDTSRKQDPQIHTHCVVLNMTQREDGAWRAVTNEEIYRSKMAAGMVYRAELASRLRQAGYQLRVTHPDGRFEVEGFTDEQLTHFSQRRADIESMLDGAIVPDAKAAERATLLSRNAKRDVQRQTLGRHWEQRAKALDINFPRPDSVLDEPELLRQKRIDKAMAFAICHLTERQVAFDERELIRHALPQVVGHATYEDLHRTLMRDVGLRRLIRLEGPPEAAERYTTPAALAMEQDFSERVQAGRECCQPMLSAEQVAQLSGEQQRLTAGQRQAAQLIFTTKDQVVGVQGYAGTGKSTLLGHVREVAQAHGYVVRGFAPSATAARILEEEAQIPSQTLASHLAKSTATERVAPAAASPADRAARPQEIWVVDETSMVGNRDAMRLMRAAETSWARVVLLGDKDQLPSIEAGKVFELLMSQGMRSVHMREIVRQKNPTLRQIVEKTVQRTPRRSLEALAPVVRLQKDDATRYQAVAAEYLLKDPAERDRALVVTPARADARAIAECIRAGLQSQAALPADVMRADILMSADFTDAQCRHARSYEPGMWVRFARAYSTLDVKAGEYWQVRGVDGEKGTVTLMDEAGNKRTWLPHRMAKVEVYRAESRAVAIGEMVRWTRNDRDLGLRNGDAGTLVALDKATGEATLQIRGEQYAVNLRHHRHWDYSYVSTVHSAQGKTADDVIIHLDTRRSSLGFESWYVALSRARRRVSLHTNSLEDLPKVVERSLQKESAMELMHTGRMANVRIAGALAFRLPLP